MISIWRFLFGFASVSTNTIQLAFCQRAVTVLSHAATPEHCWACSQRSGTLTRCSADRKLGRFQTEGQISGVGGVGEVHTTFEYFVTSAFTCDFAVHLFTPLAVSTVSRSTNCCSLNVNNFPVAIDQAQTRDSAVENKMLNALPQTTLLSTLHKSSRKESNPMFCTTQPWLKTE